MDALHKYLEFLWNSFQFDIHVFSQAWMYYWALIPAVGYLVFFILKWVVFTAPVWLPVTIILRVANLPSPKCENCLHKTVKDEDLQVDLEKIEVLQKEGKLSKTR